MIIDKVLIKKFRGFREVEFELGSHLTVISGQNGTQKTTILGMLSQPFAITDKENPLRDEKPLSGGSFKSAFADKFKLSKDFDRAGEHEWTLNFFNEDIPDYTVESIYRDKKEGVIRFWQKGSRSKGSGYIQLPVIYLSLKRLLPIGEDKNLRENNQVVLDGEELEFYKEWHNKILILTREADQVQTSNYISSTDKQTLGANTDNYDWKMNSAGQDNLSKILLAILTFRRLQKKYKKEYNGGILAIDELDATFYTGSQIKLFHALIGFASKFKIQIILTTHSLTILKEASKLFVDNHRARQVRLMFLKKEDGKVIIENGVTYEFIQNHLNRTLMGKKDSRKIDVYTEDREGAIFLKSLLGRKASLLNFIDIRLGCGNLIQLASSKVPSFTFPNSIIVLDGDVKSESKQLRKVNKLNNILLLPTSKSPEQLIANYLNELSDSDELWKSIDQTFDHSYCFKDYSLEEINNNREKAKKWFNLHKDSWGRNVSKVLNPWKKKNANLVEQFTSDFAKLYNKFADKSGLDKI